MSGTFESAGWNACVHRPDLGLYSHVKEFWGNGVRIHINAKGKIPSSIKILLRGELNPQLCVKQESEPNTLLMSCSSPTFIMFGMAQPGRAGTDLFFSWVPQLYL